MNTRCSRKLLTRIHLFRHSRFFRARVFSVINLSKGLLSRWTEKTKEEEKKRPFADDAGSVERSVRARARIYRSPHSPADFPRPRRIIGSFGSGIYLESNFSVRYSGPIKLFSRLKIRKNKKTNSTICMFLPLTDLAVSLVRARYRASHIRVITCIEFNLSSVQQIIYFCFFV